MAQLSRDTLKTFFKTGMYPTEEQFAAWLDSFVHRQDGIPITQVEGLAEALNNISDKELEEKFAEFVDRFSVDEARGWLKVNGESKRFFVALTELAAPNAPTVAVTAYAVVTGNANVTVSCTTSGVTMQYSTDAGKTWANTSGNVALASGYANDKDNAEKTVSLWVKSQKNGEESAINKYTITIKPKVAAGSVAVTRNGNNNKYSTSATITLTPSATTGATSEYSDDGGSTWKSLTGSKTVTVSSSKSADQYQVRATKTKYEDASIAKSGAFTLNAKKFYYGAGDATLTAATIKTLVGGGSLEQDTMAGEYSINNPAGKYTWFCGVGTLTSVTSSGFGVPMNSVVVVDGYNCYRSTSAVKEAGTNKFKVE